MLFEDAEGRLWTGAFGKSREVSWEEVERWPIPPKIYDCDLCAVYPEAEPI